MADVDGLETILRRMDSFATKGKISVVRAAIRGGLNAAGKQMKADLSSKVKLGRTAVKSRFKKGKTKVEALVGFGVGKRKKKAQIVKRKRTSKGGVGIGAQNVHWWIAGTKQRRTGHGRSGGHKIKNGQRAAVMNRGVMPAMQPGLARIATQKAQGKIRAAMIERGSIQLKKEIVKLQTVK